MPECNKISHYSALLPLQCLSILNIYFFDTRIRLFIVCDCRPILHKYANEDVSLGSWFIGLEVEHIDDRNMCCGTPPGKVFRIKI